jgi:hypothetical protein
MTTKFPVYDPVVSPTTNITQQPDSLWYRRQNQSGPLKFCVSSTESFHNHTLKLVYANTKQGQVPLSRKQSVVKDIDHHKVMKYDSHLLNENELSFLITVSRVSHLGPGFCLYLELQSGTCVLSEPFHVKDRPPPTIISDSLTESFKSKTLRLLRQLEWCIYIGKDINNQSRFGCPICTRTQDSNHTKECSLYALLKR